MNAVLPSFLALCLCLCPCFALAQSDPGDGCQSGLDVFFPGMRKADAKKAGATPDGKHQMHATVTWGGKKWNVVLLGKGKEVSVVGLSARLAGNEQVATMLEDMGERLAVPMLLSMEGNGARKEQNFTTLAVEGKDKSARDAIMREGLGTFAGQEKGSLTLIFCPEDMLDTLAKEMRAKGGLDEKKAMARFGDAIVYSLHMNKQDNAITVVVSTFARIKEF